jgi:hypothetical protein
MPQRLPAHLMKSLADVLVSANSHDMMDRLFKYAEAPGEPPAGSKFVKATEWLRRISATSPDPLGVLGRLIEGYMEFDEDGDDWDFATVRRDQLTRALERAELRYVSGARVVASLATPSRSLAVIIRARDLNSVEEEFSRAVESVEARPREAVSAACNILESVCKIYIEDEGLIAPAKQDLSGVWGIVRKHLGFDPSTLGDQDLQKIVSGLISVVDGIGALRTHTSSAHGAGRTTYRMEPRHARLAVHAAHTATAFIIESWDKRKGTVSGS